MFGGQKYVILLASSLLHAIFAKKPKILHLFPLLCFTHYILPSQDSLSRTWILSLAFLYPKVKMLCVCELFDQIPYPKLIVCFMGEDLLTAEQVALFFFSEYGTVFWHPNIFYT